MGVGGFARAFFGGYDLRGEATELRQELVKLVALVIVNGEQLRQVAELVMETHRELSAAGERLLSNVSLSRARFQVLSCLESQPQTVSEVARTLSLSRQAVQQVVDACRDDGLLLTTVAPGDRRAVRCELTDLGLSRLQAGAAHHAEWLQRVESALDLASLSRLPGDLGELLNAIRSH